MSRALMIFSCDVGCEFGPPLVADALVLLRAAVAAAAGVAGWPGRREERTVRRRASTGFKRDTDTGRILNGSPKQHKGVRNERWPELAPNITGEDHERPAHQLRPQEARTELRQALREDQGACLL